MSSTPWLPPSPTTRFVEPPSGPSRPSSNGIPQRRPSNASTDEVLDAYAEALESIAEIEVARVAGEAEPIVAAERLVVGTLLYEPVLLTLRRMAHEAVSARP